MIPALIRKFVEAHEAGEPVVEVWGTGKASREFLFVEDAAAAIVLATERYESDEPVNLGTGSEITIRDLAEEIRAAVGYEGELRFDASKPDGQPRRQLETSRAAEGFGFRAGTGFAAGLRRTLDWYLENR